MVPEVYTRQSRDFVSNFLKPDPEARDSKLANKNAKFRSHDNKSQNSGIFDLFLFEKCQNFGISQVKNNRNRRNSGISQVKKSEMPKFRRVSNKKIGTAGIPAFLK